MIDEERKEGIYLGTKMFIGRLANATQFLIVPMVHFFTGFVSNVEDQTPLALIGIRLHMSIIPALILLIGALIFWFFYDLTPKKTEEIHLKIEKLNI